MSYEASDIKSLSFREGVRERIQMYLGSADTNGIYQALKEIINNSTDEAIVGYGDKIEITVDEDTNFVSVRDYGRGVPFLVKEDGTNVLVDVYTKAHTGGKFDDSVYKNVSGLNGIGASCVCLSSSVFIVQTYRNGRGAEATFKEGILEGYKEFDTTESTGTYVSFIPDPKVFKDEEVHYSFTKICEDIKAISYLYSGITFTVTGKGNQRASYCARNGIMDLVRDLNKKPLHQHIISESIVDENGDKLEIAFQWGDGREVGQVFVNGLLCPEGGSPITGAKTAITRTFNSLSKQNFDGDSIRGGLVYVINCSVAQPSFANQTKSKINNANLRSLASSAFSNGLKQMKMKYNDEFETIVELLRKVARAEAAAERARQQVLNASREIEKNQKKKVFASDKLKDAEVLGEDSTLLIVEGDSAMGGVSRARDYRKFGILAIRGKMINGLSNPDEKIYENEEIKLLLSAMNIVPGKYNSKKLRYGKIGICVDADSDGYHIALLILANLIHIAPDFVKEGRLCWLRAPLWIVTNGNKRSYYFTDEEMDKVRGKIRGTITRNKGLGEMSAESMRESMFSSMQRMDTLEYDESAIELLYELMGVDIKYRKEFIMNKIDFREVRE